VAVLGQVLEAVGLREVEQQLRLGERLPAYRVRKYSGSP
jgi:hypothetical protein